MRQKIELNTTQDILEFIDTVDRVDCEVMLEGFDENGHKWLASAKSELGAFALIGNAKSHSKFGNVDWNTTTCICDKDIYNLISKWAVGSQMEA